MEHKLVSIITVCFNSEKTIEQTIRSVLEQTYPWIEYIVVDGKSDDTTLEIVKRYEERFQGRMRWISEKDSGIYEAMNKGIRLAKGEVIGMINSDDYYEKDAVEKIVTHMSEEPYQILYGFTRTLRNEIMDNIYISSPDFLRMRPMSHPACFVTKDVYAKYGMYDEQYKFVADYDFLLRMKDYGISFVPVYAIIANFRIGGASTGRRAYLERLHLEKKYNMISNYMYHKLRIKDLVGQLLRR